MSKLGESNTFGVWLDTELSQRKMSHRQFAEISGVHHSTISDLVSGKRRSGPPNKRTCRQIADALGKSKVSVLLMLDHSPDLEDFSPTELELFNTLQTISKEGQSTALALVKTLATAG